MAVALRYSTSGENENQGGDQNLLFRTYRASGYIEGDVCSSISSVLTLAHCQHILWEVHLWSKLSHENIARMLGICTEFKSTIPVISNWMGKGDAFTYTQNQSYGAHGYCEWVALSSFGPILYGELKGALLTDFGFSTLKTCMYSMTVEMCCEGMLLWMAPVLGYQ
ncbi:hypothetical protein V8B97DRAFT_3298 [Scleroderma yunnanense]